MGELGEKFEIDDTFLDEHVVTAFNDLFHGSPIFQIILLVI